MNSNSRPYFSIVIPVYNAGITIKYTLSSVLSQTFKNFEIIIVNDGSTDNTVEIISTFTDERIKVITIPNSGVSVARNRGILYAIGKYVAFLDADDIWSTERLKRAYLFFEENPDILWYCSEHVRCTQEDIEDLQESSCDTKNYKLSFLDNEIHAISGSGIIVLKELVQHIKLFPEGVRYFEDIIAWDTIALLSPTIGISTITDVYYIEHEGSAIDIIEKSNSQSACIDISHLHVYTEFLKSRIITTRNKRALSFLKYRLCYAIGLNLQNLYYHTKTQEIISKTKLLKPLTKIWIGLFLHIIAFSIFMIRLPYRFSKMRKLSNYKQNTSIN